MKGRKGQFEQKIFATNKFLPRATAFVDTSLGFVGLAFDWGSESIGADLNESVHAHLTATLNDRDFTSAREFIESASWECNQLRLALLQANTVVWNENNQKSYSAGCEYVGIVYTREGLSVARVGGPAIWTKPKTGGWSCLAGSLNWSNYAPGQPPLPWNLIGTDLNIEVQMLSAPPTQSRLILSTLPLTSDFAGDLDSLFFEFTRSFTDQPFWIGEIFI